MAKLLIANRYNRRVHSYITTFQFIPDSDETLDPNIFVVKGQQVDDCDFVEITGSSSAASSEVPDEGGAMLPESSSALTNSILVGGTVGQTTEFNAETIPLGNPYAFGLSDPFTIAGYLYPDTLAFKMEYTTDTGFGILRGWQIRIETPGTVLVGGLPIPDTNLAIILMDNFFRIAGFPEIDSGDYLKKEIPIRSNGDFGGPTPPDPIKPLFIVVRWQGNGTANPFDLDIFVNGEKESGGNVSSGFVIDTTPSSGDNIRFILRGTQQLSDWRIFSSALTDEQVAALTDEEGCPASPGPVTPSTQWRMYEPTFSTDGLQDSQGVMDIQAVAIPGPGTGPTASYFDWCEAVPASILAEDSSAVPESSSFVFPTSSSSAAPVAPSIIPDVVLLSIASYTDLELILPGPSIAVGELYRTDVVSIISRSDTMMNNIIENVVRDVCANIELQTLDVANLEVVTLSETL